MSDLELVLTMLSEATTTEISREKKPKTFSDNVGVARSGGEVAKVAREAIEKRTGKPVVTSDNASSMKGLSKKSVKALKG